MIFKTTRSNKGSVTRHGAGIMIAASNFIKRVSLVGVVPVVNHSCHYQGFILSAIMCYATWCSNPLMHTRKNN